MDNKTINDIAQILEGIKNDTITEKGFTDEQVKSDLLKLYKDEKMSVQDREKLKDILKKKLG